MATVKGPLHSTAASGQFGKAMIFQGYRNRHYVKRYAFPNLKSHPATPAQLAIQAQTKTLMQHWPDIAPADQATWDALAIPARIERVNAYLIENYKRFMASLTPRDQWPFPAQTRIYTGGSATPDLSKWMPAYEHMNRIDAFGNEIFADIDCTAINTWTAYNLDGTLDLRQLPALNTVESNSTEMTTAPIVTGCANLHTYMVFNCPVTNLPNLAGMPLCNCVIMNQTDVANFDQIFLDLAATAQEGGSITIAGTLNSRVTAASNAARAAIHAKGWAHTGWDETAL
jgi:hypothetical protein